MGWFTAATTGAAMLVRGLSPRKVVRRTVVIKTPRPAPVWPWYVAAGVGALVLLEK